jgi:hypothetical protein
MIKRLSLAVLCLFLLGWTHSQAQDLASRIHAMQNSYAASGSIYLLNDKTLVIEPKMPSPLCALPKNADGKTSWSFYTFPLSSITVPLALVDESLISEDQVFTDPDAVKLYKPGEVGDTTMIVIAGVEGKEFHTTIYDRDKFASLGPGPHSSSDYGETKDVTEAFGLTFSDLADARAFESALKSAVMLAKSQTAHP